MIFYNNQAPNSVNNVGQFGATEGSIGAYKQAAEYAADAKYWALLSQTKYNSVEDILSEVDRLFKEGQLLSEDINQLKEDFLNQEQVLLGLIQSTGAAIDNTVAATELSREATQEVLKHLDIISNMTVSVETLSPETAAFGSYNNLTGEFHFGIPEGKPGRDGTDGTISDINTVPISAPSSDDYGFFVDKEDGGLYRTSMTEIANLVPSIRSISINGGGAQTGEVAFNSVSSFNSRVGDVFPQAGDYSVSQITGAAASGVNSDITALSGLTQAVSIHQGGTGATTPEQARSNLGLGSLATESIVPINKGGTGATTPELARDNLGLGSLATDSLVPISKGGTGSTTEHSARVSLSLDRLDQTSSPVITKIWSSNFLHSLQILQDGSVLSSSGSSVNPFKIQYGGTGGTSVLSAKKKLMVSKEEEKPEIIAHRGFSKVFPENTMAAMQGALRLGANALECDLSVTSDGVVVLMHDETVDRTTNGTGKTSTLTSSYVRGLDAGSKSPNPARYAGERVPLFSDVLKMCVARQVKIYAEMAHLRSLADVSLILDIIQANGGESVCVLCAADLAKLEEVRRLNKNIFLGALSYTAPTESFLTSATALTNTYIQIPAWTASDVILKRIHDSGLLCNLWTLDTPEAIQLAISKGFMQLMLDEPLYNTKF